MDLNKFTEKSQAALMEAQNVATRHQHQAVDVEHLMLALLEQENGLAPRLFEYAKVAPDLLKAKVEEELRRIPGVRRYHDRSGTLRHATPQQALVKAQDEAKKLKMNMSVSNTWCWPCSTNRPDGHRQNLQDPQCSPG
jgi:ATP-dependent Clp protease ATP-binding subunit ClpB